VTVGTGPDTYSGPLEPAGVVVVGAAVVGVVAGLDAVVEVLPAPVAAGTTVVDADEETGLDELQPARTRAVTAPRTARDLAWGMERQRSSAVGFSRIGPFGVDGLAGASARACGPRMSAYDPIVRFKSTAFLDSVKVPVRITAVFWAIKLLTTAMGEALSDSLVHGINQYLAVVIGLVLFSVAMTLQFSARRYNPWIYWFAVAMVAVFGTMAADVLHIGLHVPYAASSIFYLVALVVIFAVWYRSEGTLSIHSIYTPRREIFYWLAVLATFALGTAVGDLTAVTFNLGYLGSGVLFAVLFVLPGLAYAVVRANSVVTFWLAYILTRPLGASFADWFGFPRSAGGLGVGHAATAAYFALPIVVLVAFLAITRIDVPRPARGSRGVVAETAPE
jgi:uncharacterized membrane-anchored protein